ncbi:MAG TPA: GIY-YIG nuclease family protein [bacterium]|nr:GIY-YIG nuclease family protein [bacterium]
MSTNSILNGPVRDRARTQLAALGRWLDDFLASRARPFRTLVPSKLPTTGGIYAISITRGPYAGIVYVGTTKNLRQRLYQNHLMGDKHASQLRNALVHFDCAYDHDEAKRFMRESCGYRFFEDTNEKERQVKEAFAIAALRPEFSIYKGKEH